MHIHRNGVAAAFALALLAGSASVAGGYPDRPVRLMHGFAAGGPADVIARVVAGGLQAQLGQSVVVEAKPGAGGNLASQAVVTATPDGHTIGLLTGGHAVSAGLYKNLPFHAVDSFEMISTVVFYSFVVATRPDFEVKTMAELVALAKAKPGQLSFGSAGIGTTQHLTGELLKSLAGIDVQHVPYRGDAAAVNGLMTGDVPFIIAAAATVAPHLAAGTLKALAVSSATRWDAFAGVPTIQESGVAGFDVTTWAGLAAPKGTPLAIVARVNAAVRAALAEPEIRSKLETAVAGTVRASRPEEMTTMVATEVARWTKVIEVASIPRQ